MSSRALLDQVVTPRTVEQVMVGGPVRVSPEEAAAYRLIREQAKRRNEAAAIAYVYRSKSGKPQVEDEADEEEVEVAVEGEWEGADPSVGIMSGGFYVYGGCRVDNGADVVLTEDEKNDIAMQEMESAADDAEDYREEES